MTSLFVDSIFIALFFNEENDYNKHQMVKPLTQLESSESNFFFKMANRVKPFFQLRLLVILIFLACYVVKL